MKNFIALSLVSLFFLASCNDAEQAKSKENNTSYLDAIKTTKTADLVAENTHKIIVKEELSSGGYIYLKVLENDKEYWMAIPGRKIEIGATYYYDGGMVMKNFESKTLKRTFDHIIFAEGIRDDKVGVNKVEKRSVQKGETSVAKLEKAPNGIRIAELFENPKAYSNKQVIIRGQVVKVNNGVMKLNFVHLQDGTTGKGKYDITITTTDEFKTGEIVTIKGTVILNKDFGAGYVYDVLIEKAVIL